MKYFKLSEFAVSSSYPRLAKMPTGEIKTNIEYLVDYLLDPVRERIGKPITVTSGYRPPELNKAIGGVSTSNHLYGYAADVVCGNNRSDNLKIAIAVIELGLDFDELLLEEGTLTAPCWIHIAVKKKGNRKKLLWKDGKVWRKIRITKEWKVEKI